MEESSLCHKYELQLIVSLCSENIYKIHSWACYHHVIFLDLGKENSKVSKKTYQFLIFISHQASQQYHNNSLVTCNLKSAQPVIPNCVSIHSKIINHGVECNMESLGPFDSEICLMLFHNWMKFRSNSSYLSWYTMYCRKG